VELSTINVKSNKKEDSDAYRRRRVFTAVRCRHVSRPRDGWILIKQVCHEPIYFSLSQTCRKQGSYQIRMTNHQQPKAKLKILPSAGSRLGSTSHGHSYACFSQRSNGWIHRRVNSSAQWSARRPESWSLATYLTKAARHGVIFGSPRFLSISDRSKCLFSH
jgi:hypothetical protein